ncbi:GAF and ANTAR domain-containing protein [Pseudonocardia saturnea]
MTDIRRLPASETTGALVAPAPAPETGGREEGVVRAFVGVADTLVDDYDVIDLLERLAGHAVALLDADAAAVMLGDRMGKLRLVASTDEQAEWTELQQMQTAEGPGMDCFRIGVPVGVTDLTTAAVRWPRFVAALSDRGFDGSVHVLPLRLRREAIGTLALFRRRPGPLPPADLAVGQALADVATIGILSERAIARGAVVHDQLQAALSSRIVIEQAKGVLAQRGRLTMNEAFDRLRRYARDHNLKVAELAREVVETDLIAVDVLARRGDTTPAPRRGPSRRNASRVGFTGPG